MTGILYPALLAPEIVDARKFDTAVPIDRGSVHQGAALEVRPAPLSTTT